MKLRLLHFDKAQVCRRSSIKNVNTLYVKTSEQLSFVRISRMDTNACDCLPSPVQATKGLAALLSLSACTSTFRLMRGTVHKCAICRMEVALMTCPSCPPSRTTMPMVFVDSLSPAWSESTVHVMQELCCCCHYLKATTGLCSIYYSSTFVHIRPMCFNACICHCFGLTPSPKSALS